MTVECKPGLTPEHAGQIHFNGIYKANPDDFRNFWQSGSRYWDVTSKYHCKNWCFEPRVHIDGRVFMTDNYWSCTGDSMAYEITDENFDEMFPKFKLAMEDKDQWRRIGADEARRYSPEDIVRDVAVDSGGYTCRSTTWVRKGAVPPLERELAYKRSKLSETLREALNYHFLEFTLSEVEGIVERAQEEHIDIFGIEEAKRISELLEGNLSEPIEMGGIADGDMEDYLSERCYCPGEIYGPDGTWFKSYSKDDMVCLLGERKPTSEGRVIESYFCRENEDIVQVIIDGDGRVADAVRFDATENNILEVLSEKMPREYSLDNFDITHGNNETPDLIEKARKAVDAIRELREALGN